MTWHVLQTQRPLSSQSITEAIGVYLFCVPEVFASKKKNIKFLEHKTNVTWALETWFSEYVHHHSHLEGLVSYFHILWPPEVCIYT